MKHFWAWVAVGGLVVASLGCGAARSVPPTVPQAAHEAPSGAPASTDGVVAGLRSRFVECYTDAVAREPGQAGKLVLTVAIDAEGAVGGVDTKVSGTLSASLIGCVKEAVQHARFPAPSGSGSSVEIPLDLGPVRSRPPANLQGAATAGSRELPTEVAGFRFGMTPAAFEAQCKKVGTLSPLHGDEPDLYSRVCDGVEVEPGMTLNMNLSFCEGQSRLCEISYWTNRNAKLAFEILDEEFIERFGEPVRSGTMSVEAFADCAKGDGSRRQTWWWEAPPNVVGRVLLVYSCDKGEGFVGTYIDDAAGVRAQAKVSPALRKP